MAIAIHTSRKNGPLHRFSLSGICVAVVVDVNSNGSLYIYDRVQMYTVVVMLSLLVKLVISCLIHFFNFSLRHAASFAFFV